MRTVVFLLACLAAPAAAQPADTARASGPRGHVAFSHGYGYGTVDLAMVLRAGAEGPRWGGAVRFAAHGDLLFGGDFLETYALLATSTHRLGRGAYVRLGVGPSLARQVDGPDFFSSSEERVVKTNLGVDAEATAGVGFFHILHVEAHVLAGLNPFKPFAAGAVTVGYRVPLR